MLANIQLMNEFKEITNQSDQYSFNNPSRQSPLSASITRCQSLTVTEPLHMAESYYTLYLLLVYRKAVFTSGLPGSAFGSRTTDTHFHGRRRVHTAFVKQHRVNARPTRPLVAFQYIMTVNASKQNERK